MCSFLSKRALLVANFLTFAIHKYLFQKMKKIFMLASFILMQQLVQAQNKLHFPKMGIKAAYLSSVTLPGFKIGVEVPSRIIRTKKYLKTDGMATTRERSWNLNLGFYHHANFHDNLYLLAERQYRRQYKKGFFMDLALGLGYSRTFLGNATYAMNANGNIEKKSLAGYNYIMYSAGSSLGYDFSKTKKLPVKCFIKSSIFAITPYNSSNYIRPTYEVGIILPLNSIKNN
jgi:hypothetical protein